MSSQFGWKFSAQYAAHMDGYELFVRFQDAPGRAGFAYVAPLELRRIEDGGMYSTPTLSDFSDTRIAREDGLAVACDVQAFMQAALDEAWRMGLRPAAFSDTTQELSAVRYHLEDMRKLAKMEK